jgi:hypothetical protein
MESSSVWATGLAHMKDPLEIVHGVEVLNSVWNEFGNQEKLVSPFREFIADLMDAQRLLSYYSHLHVFSTMAKDDDLYQWQVYSRPVGFAIGLDVNKP